MELMLADAWIPLEGMGAQERRTFFKARVLLKLVVLSGTRGVSLECIRCGEPPISLAKANPL